MRHLRSIPVLLTAVWLAGCGDQQSIDPVSPQTAANAIVPASAAATQGALLADIRAATARYHRVEAAIADGYIPVTACIPDEGIRYIKPTLVFDGTFDPSQPELLLYQPLPNDKLQLVGVQFLIPSATWDPFHSSPPSLGEQVFVDRRSPPFGAAFPNYTLLVWWLHNPNGTYAMTNPRVRC